MHGDTASGESLDRLEASPAETGEVLHIRLRKGQAASPRGVVRFAEELIARVDRAGATGEKLFRADSAFWNRKLITRLDAASWFCSISVRLRFWVREAIARIPEQAWRALDDYPEDGQAQIAEITASGPRLIVRRTRLVGAQVELCPTGAIPLHNQPHQRVGNRGGPASPARRRRAGRA